MDTMGTKHDVLERVDSVCNTTHYDLTNLSYLCRMIS